MRLRIELTLPPQGTNPNARVHWRKKARDVRDYRWQTALVTRSLLNETGCKRPRWERAIVQVTYCQVRRPLRDTDNIIASLKSAFDGLVDAGLLSDDRDVTYLPVIREISNQPGVILEVWKDTRKVGKVLRGDEGI